MTDKSELTIERVWQAPLEDIWDLWTTKDGLESWWGPDGFRVEVRKLDLRVGGELVYDMIAVDDDKVAFMKRAGMPTTNTSVITYREIVPHKRLAYTHPVDFVPGVATYSTKMRVELTVVDATSVRMTMTFDRMHDQQWTERMAAGWEMEINKLAKVLARETTKEQR